MDGAAAFLRTLRGAEVLGVMTDRPTKADAVIKETKT